MTKKRAIYCSPERGGCGVTVEAKAEFIEKPQRCMGPGFGKPCPVDLIWKVIKEEQARREASKAASRPPLMGG